MSPRKKISFVIAVLLLTALACEYLPSQDSSSGSDPEGAIATSVAATVAAGTGEDTAIVMPDDFPV